MLAPNISIFPVRLSDWCDINNVKLIHISTDCVFDGISGLYSESATSFSRDVYGLSKRVGEPENSMVLRTSIIGPEDKNFYSLYSWVFRQSKIVNGFVNHYWNGVTTWELARIIVTVINNGLWELGVKHIFGEDLTKYDLLCKINLCFNLGLCVNKYFDFEARDMRLRSNFRDFLEKLEVKSMDDQLISLRGVTGDNGGHG